MAPIAFIQLIVALTLHQQTDQQTKAKVKENETHGNSRGRGCLISSLLNPPSDVARAKKAHPESSDRVRYDRASLHDCFGFAFRGFIFSNHRMEGCCWAANVFRRHGTSRLQSFVVFRPLRSLVTGQRVEAGFPPFRGCVRWYSFACFLPLVR